MKKKMPKNYINLRIALVGICFFLLIALIGAKAFYLQVFRGSWLSKKAAGQYEKSFVQKGGGQRGCKIHELSVVGCLGHVQLDVFTTMT